MVTLEHRLRMLKISILDDGVVNLGETSILLRTIRPYVNKGDEQADELMDLLLQVRADGVVTPEESDRIAWLLNEITVERVKQRRLDQAVAASAARQLASSGAPGKTYLAANDFLRDVWRLAADIRKSEWKPDFLIALWRGGTPPGIAIQEFFKVTGWADVRHLPLKCSSYTGIGENAGGVRFTCAEPVFGMLRAEDRVLVVDDVFDTGKTAEAVKAKLDALGVEMRMATVYWKPQKNQTSLRPDYFTKDVGTEWIVFPHEIEGLTPDEIRTKDPLLANLL